MRFLKFALGFLLLIGCVVLVLLGALTMFGSAFFEKVPTFYEVLAHIGLFCVGLLSAVGGMWLGGAVVVRALDAATSRQSVRHISGKGRAS